jgi:hypothetical protein
MRATHDKANDIRRTELRNAYSARAETIDKKLKDVAPPNGACAIGQTADFYEITLEIRQFCCN